MSSTCAAVIDIGSYSEVKTKTVGGTVNSILEENISGGATRVDVVILSITGDIGVDQVVLSSKNYSDGTPNQYIQTKWGKGLFTISCASANGYFQYVDMHFMNSGITLGTCTIQYVIKIKSPSSVLEKRLADIQNSAYCDYAIFHPYYKNIVDCYIERVSVNGFTIRVVDDGGVASQVPLNGSGFNHNYETAFGVLRELRLNGHYFISVGESVRLKVCPRFDTAATALNCYPMLSVLTDRWFPTYNGFSNFEKVIGVENNISLVDNKDGFDTADIQFINLFLKDLFPNSKTVLNTSYIQEKLGGATKNGQRRIGLVFCPTTMGSKENSNEEAVSGETVYFHFPMWMLYDLNANAYYKPYIFERIDTYSSENIKMLNLDWRDSYTRLLYKSCILTVVNYLKSNASLLYGRTLYSYIDVVKVAFAGTWGEGTTLKTSTYPTASQLIEISDYISDVLFPDKLCLRSLASAMNAEFPSDYRSYILNPENPKRIGLFYDGACQDQDEYFFTAINTYTASTPELMNQVYNYVKSHPCYVECAQYVHENNIPNFCNIGTFAKYFRPCYFSLHNMSVETLLSEVNLQKVVRQTSHYVGYRPYIIINRCSLTDSNIVHIGLSLGNYGTAGFYQSYWKLRFYVRGYSVVNEDNEDRYVLDWEEGLTSSFDLSTIPTPFEVGVPNYHDMVYWSEVCTLSHTLSSGKFFSLLVAIEDDEGIYTQPIWFCNDVDSLLRDDDGTSPTGKFFLIHYQEY